MKGNWIRKKKTKTTEIRQQSIFDSECLGSGVGYRFKFLNVGAVCCLLLLVGCCCCFFEIVPNSHWNFDWCIVVCDGIDGSASMKFISHEIHLARIRCVIQMPKRRETNDGGGISISLWFSIEYITLMILLVYCNIFCICERVLSRFIYFIFFIISSINFSFCLESFKFSFKFLWFRNTLTESERKPGTFPITRYLSTMVSDDLMMIICFLVSYTHTTGRLTHDY